jgi:hypothetical protein
MLSVACHGRLEKQDEREPISSTQKMGNSRIRGLGLYSDEALWMASTHKKESLTCPKK